MQWFDNHCCASMKRLDLLLLGMHSASLQTAQISAVLSPLVTDEVAISACTALK